MRNIFLVLIGILNLVLLPSFSVANAAISSHEKTTIMKSYKKNIELMKDLKNHNNAYKIEKLNYQEKAKNLFIIDTNNSTNAEQFTSSMSSSESDENSLGSNDESLCSINTKRFQLKKSFVLCQVDEMIDEITAIEAILIKASKDQKELLKKLSDVPVCGERGYTSDRFSTHHDIESHLENIAENLKEIQNLRRQIAAKELNCDNCESMDALKRLFEELKVSLDLAQDNYNQANRQINSSIIRVDNFYQNILEVMQKHAVDPAGIKAECGNKVRNAAINNMSKARKKFKDIFYEYREEWEAQKSEISKIKDKPSVCKEKKSLAAIKLAVSCISNFLVE